MTMTAMLSMCKSKSKSKSKSYGNRIRTNKIKLLVAVSALIIIRRVVYIMAIAALPLSLLTSIHNGFAKPDETTASVGGTGAADSESFNGSSLPLNSTGASGYSSFSDVAGHWAEELIREAVFGGFITGYEDGTFRPDQPISAEHFAAVLTKGLAIPLTAAPKDTYDPMGYFQALRDVGIVKENEFTAEEWEQNLIRSVMIKLALRALDAAQSDVDEKQLAQQAAAAGLLDSEQAVVDEKPATRAEATIILLRLRKALGLNAAGIKQEAAF
jgi:hypothetical protein